jgi:predicted metal-dependent RNase
LAKAPSITLFGAAGEVTGSCTLIETELSLVVVDFGMIQGTDEEEQRNRTPPKIAAACRCSRSSASPARSG